MAGFNRWKSFGRHVRKGEKGLRIIAPITRKVTNQATGEEEDELVGFRVSTVFDISQTDGPAIPDATPRLTGRSRTAQAIIKAIKQVSAVPITQGLTNFGVDGYYDLVADEIVINEHLSVNHKAVTLVHEYTHSLVHRLDRKQVPREHEEVVAEGVAFVICKHFGLDSLANSFGYVAGWAGKATLVWTLGSEIQRTAAQTINEIETARRKRLPKEISAGKDSTKRKKSM